MAGNVWEWCLNEDSDPDCIQPGGTGLRVLVGGSGYDFRHNARTAARGDAGPHLLSGEVSFRILCVSPIH